MDESLMWLPVWPHTTDGSLAPPHDRIWHTWSGWLLTPFLPCSKQEQGGWMSDRRTGPKIRRLDMGRRFLCHSSLQNEDLPRRCLSMGRPVSCRHPQGRGSEAHTRMLSKKSKTVASGDDFHTFFGWAKKFLEIRSPENSPPLSAVAAALE